MITGRQEKLLSFLITEYISTAEPVSSKALKKITDLNISEATIRNDCQELTRLGFIEQPHTSAGRIPTKKAYKHFADKVKEQQEKQFEDFIVRQIKFAHEEIAREVKMMEELMDTLENDNLFEILTTIEIWRKKI